MPAGIYEHKPLSREYIIERAKRRFWAKVDTSQDGCWDWQGATFASPGYKTLPYGAVKFLGKTWRAHRIAYEFAVGPVPDGLLVLHHCDNPRCVRPDHLYVGDYTDNMRDRTVRGRSRWSEDDRRKMSITRRQRYKDDPSLGEKISAQLRENWRKGFGQGSPEAIAKRTASIRLAKSQKG